jgi:hypothetical protein
MELLQEPTAAWSTSKGTALLAAASAETGTIMLFHLKAPGQPLQLVAEVRAGVVACPHSMIGKQRPWHFWQRCLALLCVLRTMGVAWHAKYRCYVWLVHVQYGWAATLSRNYPQRCCVGTGCRHSSQQGLLPSTCQP